MALHLREVAKTYGKGDTAFQALKPVNFGIEPGSSIAIVGKSGSGKSTLLHLMVGLDHPSSGEILFNGKNILKDYKTDAWRGQNVGIIFQQFFLQPKDSVVDNVSLPLKLRGMGKRKRVAEAKDALRLVGLLDKAKNKANDLSGGQKQRVAIARAIVTKPAILVADEPTGNLDSENGEAVERLLFQLNHQLQTTLIIVTHDEELAARCQRIIRLRDGMIVEDTAIGQRPAHQPAARRNGAPLQPHTAPKTMQSPAVRSAGIPTQKPAPTVIHPKPPRPQGMPPKQPVSSGMHKQPTRPPGIPNAPNSQAKPVQPTPQKPVNRSARRIIQ